VKVVEKGEKEAGTYSIFMDAKDIASGIYFYRMKADRYEDYKKCVLIK